MTVNELTTKAPAKSAQTIPGWIWAVALIGVLTIITTLVNVGPISHYIENLVSLTENNYQQWLTRQNTNNPAILLPASFIGGLIASVSPCILAMLPLNLSYIGTSEIKSRRDALVKSGLFVLGVVTVLSLFGLVSSFAGSVMVAYRGYVYAATGVIILLMGLSFVGLVHLPLPQINPKLGVAGPYGVGFTFALLSSPCASPVLFAVLAAAAATGSQWLGTLTMVSYALGYTVVIFLSSLFTGLVKRSRALLDHSEWIVRFGGLALMLAGGYYLVSAILWFR